LKKICARAGKKEGDLGEGIFARPRFLPRSVLRKRDCFWGSAAAEFRASEAGAPP